VTAGRDIIIAKGLLSIAVFLKLYIPARHLLVALGKNIV
jgi:hypothetical protein